MNWEEQYARDLASQTHSGPVALDDSHREKNVQLRERVRDLLPIDDAYKLSDCDLLYRFLIGKHWNVQIAEQFLRSYVHTRREEQLNRILLTEVDARVEAITSPLYGVDHEGLPVLWISPDPSKLLALLRNLPRQVLLRGQMRVMEAARYIAKAHGVERCIYVIDLGKVTMSSINTLTVGFMRDLLKMLQDFYPEIMRRLLIYNTGWAVTAGWKMVRPFVDVRILDKIHFFHDAPTVATLAEFMSADNVLPAFGGTGREDRLAIELQVEMNRMRGEAIAPNANIEATITTTTATTTTTVIDATRHKAQVIEQHPSPRKSGKATGKESPRADRLLLDEPLIVTPSLYPGTTTINESNAPLELHSLSSSFTASMYDVTENREATPRHSRGNEEETGTRPRMVIATPAVFYTQQQQQLRNIGNTVSPEVPASTHAASDGHTSGEELSNNNSTSAASLSSTSADYRVAMENANATHSVEETAVHSESMVSEPNSSATTMSGSDRNEEGKGTAKEGAASGTNIDTRGDKDDATCAMQPTKPHVPNTSASNCLCLQLVRERSSTTLNNDTEGEGNSRVVAYQDGILVAEYRRSFVLGPPSRDNGANVTRSPIQQRPVMPQSQAKKNSTTEKETGNGVQTNSTLSPRQKDTLNDKARFTSRTALTPPVRYSNAPLSTERNGHQTIPIHSPLTPQPLRLSSPLLSSPPPSPSAIRVHFAGPIIGELLREYGHPIHNYLIVCNAERQARFVVRKSRLRSRLTVFKVEGRTAVRTDAALRHTLSQSERHKVAIVAAHPAMRAAKSTWVLYQSNSNSSSGAVVSPTSASASNFSPAALTTSALFTLRKGWRQHISGIYHSPANNNISDSSAAAALSSRARRGSEGAASGSNNAGYKLTQSATHVVLPGALLAECHPDCVYYYAPLSQEHSIAELFTLTMAISQMWGDGRGG